MATATRRFKDLLQARASAVLPGCYDAIGARLIEAAGFPAAYMSGFCVAASLGKPDVGILTMSDMVERAETIARSISIPLFSDADTGYGSIPNVVETVRRFERAGVAGLHLEDQITPKKCAAIAGKQLISIPEMEQKIKAACAARTDPNFAIVGRTDAVITDGLPEAIRRAQAWEAAGADAVMVMSLSTIEEMRQVRSAVKGPAIVLMSETIRPTYPISELKDLGFSLIIYPLTAIMMGAGAQREVLTALQAEGDTKRFMNRMMPFAELNDLAGLPEVVRWETTYVAAGS